MAKFLDNTGLALVWAQIKLLLQDKVDKETGKGLSSNDYTATEKAKLANIEAGAEVNVNADWNAVTGDAAILNKPTIPSTTSQLTNDSGFITVNDVPEGAAASTTTPAMDGTAAVGTETAFARGDHVHPSDTTKVDKVQGKQLSTEDFTTALKTKLEGIATGAEVNVNADWNANSGDAQILNKPTIPTVDTAIDKNSNNAISNAAVEDALEQLQFALANRYPHESDSPSSTYDLAQYDMLDYYDESSDTSIMLLAHSAGDDGYNNFESVDGNYKIYNQNDTWYFKEGDSAAVQVDSTILQNITGYIPQISAETDINLDKYSSNPVSNQAICLSLFNFLDSINLFSTEAVYSTDQLDNFTKIWYYVSSTDTTETLFKTGYRRFESIDGEYKIIYQNSAWRFYVDGTEGTFTLSNLNIGGRPDYTAIEWTKNLLWSMSLIFDWGSSSSVTMANMLNYSRIGLNIDGGEDYVELYRINNDTFVSILPHDGHMYKITRQDASTLKYYIDGVQQQSYTYLDLCYGQSINYASPSDIPTNNNQLTNGAGYQTASDVNSLIATAIGDLEGVEFSVVQALPASGNKSTIYLVPLSTSGTNNAYEEYVWLTSSSSFEKIGTTEVDLTDYYNTTNLVALTSTEIANICV